MFGFKRFQAHILKCYINSLTLETVFQPLGEESMGLRKFSREGKTFSYFIWALNKSHAIC